VAHISLVFREMWDTTTLSLLLSIQPMHLPSSFGGIPHLAKNQRDVGHPSFVREREKESSTISIPVVFLVLYIGIACNGLDAR